jgi:very-short-patch-repair endonuclease
VLAACLFTDGVTSHRAAAALWRLDGAEPVIVEITARRRLRAAGVLVHRGSLAREDVTALGRFPVTSVARTLLDLGAVVDAASVEAAVTDALRRRLTTAERLKLCLDRSGGHGRRGAKVLRAIVESLEEHRPESLLELKLIRLLRRSGLPEPVSQYAVRDEGRVVARVDLAYPAIRLAIEADGYRYHGGPDAWKRDLGRRNALTALGWHTVHFTWEDVSTRPNEVVRQIQGLLITTKR